MLPSHLTATGSSSSASKSARLGDLPPPPPSLCITGAMCSMGRLEVRGGVLAYSVFRPRQLKDTKRPPLLVLHGGPGIPSNYLLPLVNVITDRSIIYYDQLGCGRSSRPGSNQKFCLTDSIEHLIAIVKHLDLPSFHLFGHSFGGILAFEYMKVAKPNNCQSLTLASAPTSTKLILEETHRLSVELAAKMGTIATEEGDEDGDEDEDEIQDTNQKKKQSDAFSKVHECRLEFLPLALQDAYAQAAPTSWRGLQAIEDYQAETESPVHVPPTMIIVGEYDFCTSKCLEGWHELLNPPPKNVVSVQGTSHYGMLENEGEYGKAVFEFIKGNDP